MSRTQTKTGRLSMVLCFHLLAGAAGLLTITAPPPVVLWLLDFNSAEVILAWSAATNATYHVQFETDLNGNNWQDLAGEVTAVSDTASKTDTKTSTNRFYRIMVVQ